MVQRQETMDSAKGLAIFLVVFGHALQYTIAPAGGDYFGNPLFQAIYSFHMPLFMLISGYLAVFSVQNRTLHANLRNKTTGILVPYTVWTVILVFISAAANIIGVGGIHLGEIPSALCSALFRSPDLWFLYAHYFMYLLLFLSVALARWIGPAAYVLMLILLWTVPEPIHSQYGIYYLQFFYVFFLGGYALNRPAVTEILRPMTRKWTAVLLLMVIALEVVLIAEWNTTDFIYVHKMTLGSGSPILEMARMAYRMVTGFTGSLLVLYLCKGLVKTKLGQPFILLGRYSLDIYLLQHVLFNVVYERVYPLLHWKLNDGQALFYGYCLFGSVIAVSCCVAFSQVVIRRSKGLNALLLGGRGSK
ncbi:acyltransferase family protein [Paenibacillus sp. NFR01]|uniref:acyltransferase family protein n=1 Tax=Paenibacillus sp. NFR01 TaxID=1566279 RepID=UPI0008AAA4E5|nr:acyltransferase family protein [Paenibacillus sp. NFR01]SET33307.1 Fucose 4-O-acetylase [Paenibacillus sp. NFR01]